MLIGTEGFLSHPSDGAGEKGLERKGVIKEERE